MNFIKLNDLCKRLSITRQTVNNMRKEGLPSIVIGKRDLRFNLDEVVEWLRNRSASK